MAVTSGFYNSVNHDRKYNASQLANLLDGVINDGVFMTVGDHFAVTANTGMTIKVGLGRAWFNKTWLENDAQLVLTVESSDLTMSRIDAVVIEVNTTQEVRAGTIKVVKGSPNATPVAPTPISTATVHQYLLATISVGANVSSIAGDKITNKVGTVDCPYVSGILETSTVEAQTAAWEAKFIEWFDGVRETLSGDVAGNLLNLINQRVKYTDKASSAEAIAGTDDLKYITAASAKVAIENRAKIGDIKIQADANGGPGWALCNGAPITRASLPELFDMTDWTNPLGAWTLSSTQATGTYEFIKVINGLTFIGCSLSTNSGINSDAVLYVYQKGSLTPTTAVVMAGTSKGSRWYAQIKDITFDGTQYIAVVPYYQSMDPQYKFTLLTSPDGITWTDIGVTVPTPSSGTGYSLAYIKKMGGYYAVVYNTLNTSGNALGVSIAFSANLVGGSWGSAVIATPTTTYDQQEYPLGLFYENGIWEVITWGGGNGAPVLYKYTSSNIATGWSRASSGRGDFFATYNYGYHAVKKINGMYLFTGAQNSSNGGARLRYSTNFTTWTDVTVTGADNRLTNIIWTGKYWVVSDTAGNLFFNTQLVSSGWTKVDYKNLDPKFPAANTGLAVITMEEYLSAPDQIALGGTYLMRKRPSLPLMSVRDAYAFIKTTLGG